MIFPGSDGKLPTSQKYGLTANPDAAPCEGRVPGDSDLRAPAIFRRDQHSACLSSLRHQRRIRSSRCVQWSRRLLYAPAQHTLAHRPPARSRSRASKSLFAHRLMHEHRFIGRFDPCKIAANRLACIEYALPCSHREFPRCESMEGCCENKAMGMENTPAGTENGVACIENVEAGRENRPPCIDNMEACIENKQPRVDYMEARSKNRDPCINDMDSRGSHYWLRFADALPVSLAGTETGRPSGAACRMTFPQQTQWWRRKRSISGILGAPFDAGRSWIARDSDGLLAGAAGRLAFAQQLIDFVIVETSCTDLLYPK